MLQPLDRAIPHDDDVETYAAALQFRAALQKKCGSRSHAALFAAAHAGRGSAESFTGARTHFGDHQQIAVTSYDIDLADAAQEIARHDGESL